MDAMILCLPIFEVYKLHVSTKVKVAIGASFLIGALVIIASIIKLVVMVELYHMALRRMLLVCATPHQPVFT